MARAGSRSRAAHRIDETMRPARPHPRRTSGGECRRASIGDSVNAEDDARGDVMIQMQRGNFAVAHALVSAQVQRREIASRRVWGTVQQRLRSGCASLIELRIRRPRQTYPVSLPSKNSLAWRARRVNQLKSSRAHPKLAASILAERRSRFRGEARSKACYSTARTPRQRLVLLLLSGRGNQR